MGAQPFVQPAFGFPKLSGSFLNGEADHWIASDFLSGARPTKPQARRGSQFRETEAQQKGNLDFALDPLVTGIHKHCFYEGAFWIGGYPHIALAGRCSSFVPKGIVGTNNTLIGPGMRMASK
jgi:hypothetical protein